MTQTLNRRFEMPRSWNHAGLVLARPKTGFGTDVVGDPCIVRDAAIGGYRMFLFCHPPGHAQSICRSLDNVGPGQWSVPEPLTFTNPDAVPNGWTHKPYVVQEAFSLNEAALIDGRYCLVSVGATPDRRNKLIHQAWATSLAGPWTWDKQTFIALGEASAFDARHADAVTGFYFPKRREILYYYMGYPEQPQNYPGSPFGNAQGAAVQRVGEAAAHKLGCILPPCQKRGHWASGWIGGLQLIPGIKHRWMALINASPTPPDRTVAEHWTEEPPPSLGGFAVCDEEFPVKNWRWLDDPIEWVDDIPAAARAAGEGTNLWRHHLLMLPDGRSAIFYNSGAYGTEQLYMKLSAP